MVNDYQAGVVWSDRLLQVDQRVGIARALLLKTQRRRLLFDLELVQKSMGRPVLA